MGIISILLSRIDINPCFFSLLQGIGRYRRNVIPYVSAREMERNLEFVGRRGVFEIVMGIDNHPVLLHQIFVH